MKNGTITVYKPGIWELRWYGPLLPNGRRRQQKRRFHGTKQEAVKELERLYRLDREGEPEPAAGRRTAVWLSPDETSHINRMLLEEIVRLRSDRAAGREDDMSEMRLWKRAIGKVVQTLREEKLLDHAGLAARMDDYHESWPAELEEGKVILITFKDITQLAFAFGLSVTSLVGMVERRFWELQREAQEGE